MAKKMPSRDDVISAALHVGSNKGEFEGITLRQAIEKLKVNGCKNASESLVMQVCRQVGVDLNLKRCARPTHSGHSSSRIACIELVNLLTSLGREPSEALLRAAKGQSLEGFYGSLTMNVPDIFEQFEQVK